MYGQLLGAVAGGGGGGLSGGGQSSMDTTAQTTNISTHVSQGNISFGGIDDDTIMWIAVAVLGLGALYIFSRKRG